VSTDFRVKSGYFSNLKTMKLEHRFGSGAVVGHLRLIEYCAINKPDGVFDDMEAEDIELIAHWNGEAGAFFEVLLSLRLLDEIKPGLYAMHDWEEHNPYVFGSEMRSERARKAGQASQRSRRTRSQRTGGQGGVKAEPAVEQPDEPIEAAVEQSAQREANKVDQAVELEAEQEAKINELGVELNSDQSLTSSSTLSSAPSSTESNDVFNPVSISDSVSDSVSVTVSDSSQPSPINTAAANNPACAREEAALSDEEAELLRKLTSDFGNRPALERSDALRLLCAPRSDGKSPLAVIRQQLRYWPYRQPGTSPRPFLIKAIDEDWAAPPGWIEAKKRHDDETEKRREREKIRDETAQRDAEAERQRAEFEAWRTSLPADLRQQASLRAIAQMSKNPAVKTSLRRCQADGIDLLAHKPISGVYQAALKAAVDAIRGGQK